MITVHHLHQSRSFRVLWLMEELGLPYDMVCHDRKADRTAADTLARVHKLGRSPVITDEGRVMFESGAILSYIVQKHGHGRLAVPPHHADYGAYLQWLHAAEGTCQPALRPILHASRGGPPASEAQFRILELVLRLADDALEGRGYFGGSQFTASDIMMEPFVYVASMHMVQQFKSFAWLTDWLERVRGREAFARAQLASECGRAPEPA